MSAADIDRSPRTRPANVVLNWVLALTTILGAAGLVVLAYGKVMASAACTSEVCEVPSEVLFTVLLYGPPVVAAAAVILSFFTARRPKGIVVPVVAWLLLAADLVMLMVSFQT
ncbi:hypothetical protein BVC93_10090 [Mycobacterium sp. MS1601]|uniref:hypothetical protein n=1 Tax=Mycobacterium sp. MS1601 TaxID=1936029 RepID=UPI0009798364|nr:hypothetical protein [Mycobacterium sp. MS1601]AQA02727.1 hypothetical protein BVC93_10090 [Mycobacterium sp. MS1601]